MAKTTVMGYEVQGEPKNSQHENHDISQKCANMLVPNFAHLFST